MAPTTTPRPAYARQPTASPSNTHRRAGDGPNPSTAGEAQPAAAPKLTMVAIEQGGVVLVAAEANITAADVDPTRRNPFETLLGATWNANRVLLDMDRAGYIDSSAIGWLMSSHKSFREGGGALVIYNVQPPVRQLLDVLKLGRVLTLVADERAARQHVQANGGAQ